MTRALLGRAVWTVLIVVALVVAMLPFFFMAITSLQKTTSAGLSFDLSRLDLSNFARLFTDYGFGSAIVTSGIVVVIACVLNLVVASLAAYAFEKKPFPGSEAIFVVYICLLYTSDA